MNRLNDFDLASKFLLLGTYIYISPTSTYKFSKVHILFTPTENHRSGFDSAFSAGILLDTYADITRLYLGIFLGTYVL